MLKRLLLCFLLLTLTAAAALERQPNQTYRARRQALAQKAAGGVVLLFAPAEGDAVSVLAGFAQEPNFFYLTGWAEPGAALLIVPERKAANGERAQPYAEILFLPARNPSQEAWHGRKLAPGDPEAARETGFERVLPIDKLHEELFRLLPQTRATIYTQPGPNAAAAAPLAFLRRANTFPYYTVFADAGRLLAEMRVIKDAGELALMQKAVDRTVAAHLAAMRAVRPEMSERQVHALMMHEFMSRGCERPGYGPIVAAGRNSTALHYKDSSGMLRDGDVIKLDVGAECSGYVADITRTLPVNGKFTPRQREIYEIVLGAHQAAVRAFQAGKSTIGRNSPNSLYKVAYDYINSHGKDRHGQPLGKYFIHGLSHYVGLQVHDVGDQSRPLAPGMVFTIEPGIYIPEENLGVRIEDMFYVDDAGKLVNMSASLPRTIEEVERAMAEGRRAP